MSRFYSFCITLLFAAIAACGQEPPAGVTDLTPRVDTLWTRTLPDLGMVDFQGCALGGTPQVFLVAAQKEKGIPGYRKVFIVMDPITGDTLRTVPNGHYGGVQDMSFARDANVFASCEGTVIKVWRWPEMELIRTIYCDGEALGASSALLTNDGTRVFDAASGVMFDVASGDTVWFVGRRLCNVAKPKLSTDGHFLLVHDCGVNAMFHDRGILFDAETGQELGSFGGGSGDDYIAAMAVSAEGRYVAITREYGDSPPANGSLIVYDRDTKTVLMNRSLPAADGGARVDFTPGATGVLLGGGLFGNSQQYWDWDYYPAWSSTALYRFCWMGQYFSKDWTLNYGFRHSMIGISRFNLETVGVQEELPPSSALYPNPGDGTITAVVAASDGPVVFTISDVSGREASTGTAAVTNGRCHLHATPPLPAGTYVLRLSRAGQLLFSSPLVVR